jgi:CRISPR-associated protein Csb3
MNPTPNIQINVDLTNPGQFFACCGLLELADRLWPGAEGWFDLPDGRFEVACGGTIRELLDKLASASVNSSLTDSGLKRLGTLLSADKSKLSDEDELEKERLHQMWQRERIHLSTPFDIWLDWWWDEFSSVTILKTWAAKQLVLDMSRPMLVALTDLLSQDDLSDCLSSIAPLSNLPFYFDAANNTQHTPRDHGVAPHVVTQAPTDRPLVELLTFIALQRFRPLRKERSDLIRYAVWTSPLPPDVASSVLCDGVQFPQTQRFAFRMLYRTKYMKAILPAQPFQGD